MLNSCTSHVALRQNLVVLQVARCTKIINPGTDEAKYVINVKQIAKVGPSVQLQSTSGLRSGKNAELINVVQFVVGLGDKVAPTDVEEGMRVG